MRGRRAAGAVALALTAAGCAGVTAGTGSGAALQASTDAQFPSPSSTPPSATAAASTSATSTSPSVPAPTTGGAPPASAAPRPAVCASGVCKAVATSPLDGGYRATVYSAPSPSGAAAATVTELSLGTVPVYWHVTDDANPSQLSCSPAPRPNCGLALFVGAHASEAVGLLRVGEGFQPYGQANSNTPTTKVGDLNGDGWIDVSAIQNTYRPSYATAKVYWQTSTSDGTTYTSTGCGTPSHQPPPAPAAPLTGTCPTD